MVLEMKGPMGGLYRITEWITRIAFTNILWVLCSLPFLFFLVTKFMMMVQVPDAVNEQILANWIMGILAPFVLFPATAAMFTVVRKWVMGDPDIPVFKTFFRGYKENYKQAMIGGFVYTLLFVIMYIDYTVYMTQMGDGFQLVGIIMLVLLLVLFVSLFNFFSMAVHYEMKSTQLLKNAVLLTLIRPFRVFSTLVGSALLIFIGIRVPVLFVFFLFCIMAVFAFFNFYGTYMKMQEQAERMKQQEEEESAEQALLESMEHVKSDEKSKDSR